MKPVHITHSAISLALIFVCFSIFRGTTNILNSMIVPFVLYLNMRKLGLKSTVTTMLGMVILCTLFFKFQIFFAILYSLMALLLKITLTGTKPFLLKFVVLFLGAWLGFTVTLFITDSILGTNIMTALSSIMGGWYPGVFLLIAVEAVVVGLTLAILPPFIEKRLTGGAQVKGTV